MSIRRSLRSALALLLPLAAATASLHAVQPNRIAAVGTRSVTLPGNISGRLRAAADLGQAPLDRPLTSVTVFFSRTDAQAAALTQLLADQQNPASPLYHQWLTPQQFGAQFGLSSDDLGKLTAWLTSQGLTVTGVAPSSTFVTVSGSVAQVQRAFNISIHSVSLDGEPHIANISDPVLPSGIAAVVSGIGGLNDFRLKPRIHPRTVHPNFTSSVSGSHFVAPGDFNTIYDVNPLLSASVNGTGITVAVMGQTDISLADVAAFRSASGLIANAPSVIVNGTDPGTQAGDLAEAQLDVEWSGAVAPNAKILYINSMDVVGGSLVYAIANKVAPILSISYGNCEPAWGPALLKTFNANFQQANVQGQTIIGPGGDSGATDCDYSSSSAADGLTVDFPASSPFVTGAGGTMFNEGTGSYWGTTNGTAQGSATGYIPELPWNETSAQYGLSAGGGGSSAFFAKPAWQTGPGVPNDFARDVPDVSLAAASSHDGFLYCVSGSCVNGFRAADQTLSVVGGTSVSAPSLAGILALLEQKISPTKGLGNINPTIYALANSTFAGTVFHDITSGNNSSPCLTGTPDCPVGGSIGYTAGPGYDRATGWGSINAFNLVNTWGQVPALGLGSAGSTFTTTTVTVGSSSSTTSAACGIATGTAPVTIAVAGTGSVAPTGSVQVLIDNVPVGTSTLAGGSVVYTLNTGTLASGGHTLSVSYLGDANFAGSRGSAVIDTASTSAADFSLTPCVSSTTAKTGAAAPNLTLTLTPFHGFTGPVTFSVNSDGSFSGAYNLTSTTVTVSGTGTQTDALTLYAYASNAQTSTGRAVAAASHPLASHPGRRAYLAGSGITLAAMLLFGLPRRRRLASLLAVLVSVGVLSASGCGGGNLISNGGVGTGTGTGTGTNPVNTNAIPGTYTLYVTATATTATGTLVHTVPVTFTVSK